MPPHRTTGRFAAIVSPSPLLRAGSSQLLIVDVQARLLPAMGDAAAAACRRALTLLAVAADQLGVPVTVTEHVPHQLGSTDPDLLAALPEPCVFDKVRFGATGEAPIREHLSRLERPQVVVAGLETHVCVLQTVLGLLQAGLRPAVVANACRSRLEEDHERALDRMGRHGADILTADMVAFEWLHRADHPARRAVIAAVKAAAG